MSNTLVWPCQPACSLKKPCAPSAANVRLPILCSLMVSGESRYKDLLKNLEGISAAMLYRALKELETDGLITRRESLFLPIRAYYALTPKARELKPILEALIRWSEEP